MRIRRFVKNDQNEVKKFITNILSGEFEMEQKAYMNSDLDSISDVYGKEREFFFVAEDDGRISGTVGVKEESKNTAILRRLFVGPAYRGKGYGRLLIDKALDFCKDKGYHEVVFHASTTMNAAMALCKAKGFKEKDVLELGGIQIIRFSLSI